MPKLSGIISAFAIIALFALIILVGGLSIGPAGSGLRWPDDYIDTGVVAFILVAVIIALRPQQPAQPAEVKKEKIGIRIAKGVLLALGIILLLLFIGLTTG